MNRGRTLKRAIQETAPYRLYRDLVDFIISGLPRGPYRNNFYDQQTVEVMNRVLRHDSNCIDLGAHAGALLHHMWTLAPLGTHYAFEPLPRLAGALRERFPGVRVVEAAVSDYCGRSEFHHVVNDPGYSGLRPRLYDRSDPEIHIITVRVVTLDAIIPKDHVVDFLKIDIEGGEYHALRGGTNTILRCKPVIVFEAAARSTGQYIIEPTEFYNLVTRGLGGYHISTMTRWFRRWPPLTVEQFGKNWTNGPNFYFIALPMTK